MANEWLVLYAILYKIACLAVGLACVFMGYELFMAGVMAPESFKGASGSANIQIEHAAPGTLFALFGCVVIGLVVWRGLGFDVKSEAHDGQGGSVDVDTLVAAIAARPLRGKTDVTTGRPAKAAQQGPKKRGPAKPRAQRGVSSTIIDSLSVDAAVNPE